MTYDRKDQRKGIRRTAIILIAVALAFYLGFILINVLNPQMMKTEVLFGTNLAIVYGFGLIIVAVIMGLIYNRCCTKKEDELNKEEDA